MKPDQLRASFQVDCGPIHSLAADTDGSLYLSDEFNHAVLCLDPSGSPRWSAGGFRYPRGLACGWLAEGEERRQCLAVCDSWHDRLVFLDSGGRICAVWERGGEIPFREVADVRYFAAEASVIHPSAPSGPCWLVLDRGNHRLCALDLTGRLLFQIGREMGPGVRPRWPATPADIGLAPAARGFPPFDPLYYPTTFVGSGAHSLFVVEPLRRSLRQVVLGNLVPVPLPSDEDEWVSADDSGLLGWCQAGRRLTRYGPEGGQCGSWQVEGRPLPGRSTGFVCVQRDASFAWMDLGGAPDSDVRKPFSFLRQAVRRQILAADGSATAEPDHDILECGMRLVDLVQAYLDARESGGLHPGLESQLGGLIERRRQAVAAHPETVAHLLRRLWAIKLLSDPRLGGDDATDAAEEETLRPLTDPFVAAFPRLAGALDDLFFRDRARNSPLAGEVQEHLAYCARWAPRHLSTRKPALREIGRIVLEHSATPPVRPYAILPAADGGFIVSLFARGTLLHCDEHGRTLAEWRGAADTGWTSPLGMAFAADGRIWVVDWSGARLSVLDPRSGGVSTIPEPGPGLGRLSTPVGICPGPQGSMLVADTGNAMGN